MSDEAHGRACPGCGGAVEPGAADVVAAFEWIRLGSMGSDERRLGEQRYVHARCLPLLSSDWELVDSPS